MNTPAEEHIRKDRFANRLGATMEIIEPGYSRVALTVTKDMLNFHGITHGGLVFALGDIAFGAASNASGQIALALNVAINFLKATGEGDHLVAEAREIEANGPTALYDIVVTEEKSGQCIAKSQATVYRKRSNFI